MIYLENLNYKNILMDINLNIPKGITYLYGANGSGKSTLLDCISNINTGYTGNIRGNESIIYVNQNLYFSPRLSSKDFVSFVLTLEGIKNYKEHFYNYVECFDEANHFEKMWDKPVGMLSGGEIGKLLFSTMTCIDREWYIFDESFAGIDEQGKDYILHVIEKLDKEGKGIILTTHEKDLIGRMECVNSVHISEGKIVGVEI